MKNILSALTLMLASTLVFAQATPLGLWKTIDDETKTEKSLVRLTEAGGVVSGKVEKVFDAAKQDAKCDKCSDDRKDKLVLGMTIVRNVKQNADDKAIWDGGDILDPNNGKVYRLRMKPLDGGKALEVRGYIGPFFRNQQWIRVE
ncbi:MAG: DUF2147 domain-containing protein [Ideonella sp.]|nr:DUF2147 domain-containing protein [Ideonella sp.]MBL0149793.1 DUF2147 domain-containing protein [Ideonella sp.]